MLEAVIGYIAQDSQQAAAQVLDEALRAGAGLATFPERVLVVAFLHGARDFAAWKQS